MTGGQEVRRECEYETELSQRRLEKLRKFFLDDVEVEAIEIRGLKTPSIRVSCFRTTRLSPETQAELAKIHQLLDQERYVSASSRRAACRGAVSSLSESLTLAGVMC